MRSGRRYQGLLIYHPQSNLTAKPLAKLLSLKPIRLDRSIKKLIRKYRIKIRYGNSHEEQQNDTVINSVDNIKLASSSTLFSKFCENNEILSPVYRPFNIDKVPAFPFLLRDRYHRAGKDIVVVNQGKDFANLYPDVWEGKFWVPFVETKYECRLHFVLGDIVRIFSKVPGNNSNIDFPIRTTTFGWHYKLRDKDTKFSKAKDAAMKCAEIMGLKFGAIDMAWVPDEEKYIIWEVNTAPGLNTNTLQVYADKLREVI